MKNKECKCKECSKDIKNEVKRIRKMHLCIKCFSDIYEYVSRPSITKVGYKDLKTDGNRG